MYNLIELKKIYKHNIAESYKVDNRLGYDDMNVHIKTFHWSVRS